MTISRVKTYIISLGSFCNHGENLTAGKLFINILSKDDTFQLVKDISYNMYNVDIFATIFSMSTTVNSVQCNR